MIKYVLSGLFVAIAVFVYRTASYVGAFKDVAITVSEEPAKNLVFKTHIGAYHKIVPVIESVEAWAREHKIDCRLSFGEYLDNPDIAEEDRLKSHGGCVVPELPKELPKDFESKILPAQKFVKAVFDGSPGIGPLKVYPKVQSYAHEHNLKLKGTVLEVYEIHDEIHDQTMSENKPLEPQKAEEGAEKLPVKMTTTYYFFLE